MQRGVGVSVARRARAGYGPRGLARRPLSSAPCLPAAGWLGAHRVGIFLVACGLCAIFGCSPAPRRETVEHGRFEPLELSVPSSPRGLTLLLAGARERGLADALGEQALKQGVSVARVDADAFARVLEATPNGCVFPSGDLDNLSHFIQAYLKLPSYQPAILIGLGTGAGLAAGALLQAPEGTFAGAAVFDFCGSSPLRAPLCPRENGSGLATTLLDPALADPLRRLRTANAAPCAVESPAASAPPPEAATAFGATFSALAAAARARATSAPVDMADMPIVEVAARGPAHADTFAVLLSGDGGWAGLDKALSERLARRGLAVVGVDSLRYFWTPRNPEGTAADLDRVIQHYQAKWQRPRVVLLGYSQGADVLPFILNRLPAKTRGAIASSIAFSLSTSATFEFHLRNWIGASGDRPTLPETQPLAHASLVCVYGKDDGDALCPQLDPSAYRVIQLPGDHHFNGDYDRLSTIVLETLTPI